MTLRITRPDDWHVHLRDGAAMRSVVGATARVFGRAVVMPNLKPPVTTVDAASAYRERIAAALPAKSRFAPLMTLYLTPVVYTYLSALVPSTAPAGRHRIPAVSLTNPRAS